MNRDFLPHIGDLLVGYSYAIKNDAEAQVLHAQDQRQLGTGDEEIAWEEKACLRVAEIESWILNQSTDYRTSGEALAVMGAWLWLFCGVLILIGT